MRGNCSGLLLEAAEAIGVGGKRDEREDFIRADRRAEREWHDRRIGELYSAHDPTRALAAEASAEAAG
jgi:hypothetical protein